ncbi:unnamed protein product [Mytilus edulis]|uniref:Uncharacterized protein n=1 Tax=Mytilus edulis TaxID=6550 RepID=A0A8S3UF18_MYTED|nr:unnamed protein product [Mytilus edulis]
MEMESKKESDYKQADQELDQIIKIVAELTKKLRLNNVHLKNLHEDELEETTQNEQELNGISKKIEEVATGFNKLTIETAELHNNRLKWRELANIPTKREETGRNNVQATDSGIGSSTYSGTSMVMESNKIGNKSIILEHAANKNEIFVLDAFTGIQDTNPHQSSLFISSDVDGRHEASAENGKDSECEC